MSPNDQEKLDLAELQVELNKEARAAMDAARATLRTTEIELKSRGYKTMPEALVGTVKFYLDRMDKLKKAHISKYPD